MFSSSVFVFWCSRHASGSKVVLDMRPIRCNAYVYTHCAARGAQWAHLKTMHAQANMVHIVMRSRASCNPPSSLCLPPSSLTLAPSTLRPCSLSHPASLPLLPSTVYPSPPLSLFTCKGWVRATCAPLPLGSLIPKRLERMRATMATQRAQATALHAWAAKVGWWVRVGGRVGKLGRVCWASGGWVHA